MKDPAVKNFKRAPRNTPLRGSRWVHGMAGTPEYSAWRCMVARCTKPKHRAYASYGGRGIRVCQEWITSFQAFYASLGPRPSEAHSLDRIDNNKDYEPGNCRWATAVQQQRNTRQNLIIEYNGKSLCLAEWAEITGFSSSLLHSRFKSGWSPERAFTTPSERRVTPEIVKEVRELAPKGAEMKLVAIRLGLSRDTIRNILKGKSHIGKTSTRG